jgi:hypothetical protein
MLLRRTSLLCGMIGFLLLMPAATCTAQTGTAANPPQPETNTGWKFEIAPYIWLPGIKGQEGVDGQIQNVNLGVSQFIKDLNLGGMLLFGARIKRFTILNDFFYVSLTDKTSLPTTPPIPLKTTANLMLEDPEIGYRLVGGDQRRLDAYTGVRFWHASNAVSAGPINLSGSANWADPILGLSAQTPLPHRFFTGGKADIGGFGAGSHFTWQLFGEVGREFGSRYRVAVGYRYLHVNYTNTNTGFTLNSGIHGIVAGVGIYWR